MDMAGTIYGMSGAERKNFFRYMESRYPETWAICHPRSIRDPRCGEYYPTKLFSAQLLEIAERVRTGAWGRNEQIEFQIASLLVDFQVPILYLSPAITEAIGRSGPPGAFEWFDMKTPFPAMGLMIPKGTLQHPSEGDMAYVGFARFQPGERRPSKLGSGLYGSTNGGVHLFACSVKGFFFHWNLPKDDLGPLLSLGDIEHISLNSPTHQSDLARFATTMTREDNLMMVTVAHYVFGVLMLMNTRPSLVVEGKLEKRVSKKGKPTHEFWSPSILGETYRIRQETTPPVGSHASPIAHWVRGFWRDQPHGPERSLRKQVWIEPYFRGA